MAQQNTEIVKTFREEIESGERFEFGNNWLAFLETLDDERILVAEKSLKQMLETDNLIGKTFLDIGNGSGLFSLAARRLGAKVFSFDFDDSSFACVKELKSRYFAGDEDWQITQGSVLDRDFLSSLGQFDIVYSWGVLHHTGEMWKALDNVTMCVKDGGSLFIAIYNDEGTQSKIWHRIKRVYNQGFLGRLLVKSVFYPLYVTVFLLIDLLKLQSPTKRYSEYKKRRGMSMVTDWKDWLGGYPFEVATSAAIFDFYKSRGFALTNLISTNRLGCNEFVFKKL